MADRLTLSIRNYLAQQPEVTSLLGHDDTWDTWIFADKPYAQIEKTGKAMLVIQMDNGWTAPNPHNTMKFPRIYVDVWADPDRNKDGSVKKSNADDKIIKVQDAVMKFLHTVSMNMHGKPIVWGTAAQMKTYTGVIINGSAKTTETVFNDVTDGGGARMGSSVYGVNQL
jgi:predicted metal-dependent RNase